MKHLTYLMTLVFLCGHATYAYEVVTKDLQYQTELESQKLQSFLDAVTKQYEQSPTNYLSTGSADINNTDAYWHQGQVVYLKNAYALKASNGQIEAYVTFKDDQPGINVLMKGLELKFIALGNQAQIINVTDGIGSNEENISGFLCQRVADVNNKKFATISVSGNEVNLSHTLPPPYTGCE